MPIHRTDASGNFRRIFLSIVVAITLAGGVGGIILAARVTLYEARRDAAAVVRQATIPPAVDADTSDAGDGRGDSGVPTVVGQLSTEETTDSETSDDIEYVLLLGVDKSRYQMGRTDAMIVAAFNHTTDQIGVLSIPRDIWVDVPGLQPARINAVVRKGEVRIGKGAGVPLLHRVIQRELGIEIDHTITADFDGFVNIVDFLDGIPVTVACPIEDCFHTDAQDAGCDPLVLSVGDHVLNGATALKFARSRHGRSDIDRGRRQQMLLAGLKDRLTRPAVIPKLPRLWKKLKQYIQTDLDLKAAFRIGLLVATANRRALHGLVLRTPLTEEATLSDGKQVLLLDNEKAKRAVANIFNAPAPGKRRKGRRCPAADVGLHFREKLKQRRPTEDSR